MEKKISHEAYCNIYFVFLVIFENRAFIDLQNIKRRKVRNYFKRATFQTIVLGIFLIL